MKKIFTLLFLTTFSFGTITQSQIEKNAKIVNKNLQENEERKIFNNKMKNINYIEENKTYDTKAINIEDDKTEESCIKIENINVKESTIFNRNNFEDLIKPYLNNCNGIKNLNNLTNKISNMYIEKGYVTSRAYIKGQDLSNGIVDITILEGKVEEIVNKNVNSKNIYSEHKNKILNIKDLEVSIQQAERLKSQSVSLKLLPGTKSGYTIVHILGTKTSEPYYGDISINNFGSKKTGKHQISGSFTYENLLDLNDILSIRLNSTDNVIKSNNNTLGNSLSYSIPYSRALFSFDYSNSEYQQATTDEFGSIFQSDGDSSNYTIGIKYKLFHSKKHTLDLNGGFEHKNSNNFLNDTKLEIQSYKLSVFNLGLKHSYIENLYNYYSIFTIYKGMDILGAEENAFGQESDFIKYVLDLNYTKYFKSSLDLRYNFSLRGQYSSNYLYGTEEISFGGPYSVRGFKDVGLSGNTGFYSRNELSFSHRLDMFKISPYVGVDYGYISKEDVNVNGFIVGSTLGLRVSYKDLSVETFYTNSLKDTKLIEGLNDNFFGLNFTYQY